VAVDTDPVVISRAHAARDVLFQIVGRIGNLLLGVVVVVVIVRLLGVIGNGEWSTLMAISVVTAYILEPGLQPTTLRMAAATHDEEAEWLGALVVLRVFTGVLAALVCFGWTVAVARNSAMVIAGALVAGTALTSPLQALSVVFQLRVRNDRSIWFMTLNSVAWTAAVLAIAVLGGGLIALAAALVLTLTLTSVVQGIYVLRTTPVALRGVRRHGRQLVRVGLTVGLAGGLTIAYGKIDQVLVLHYEGLRDAGLYGAAYTLLDRVQFLPMVLMTTLFPIAAAAWPADPERARRAVQRVLGYMSLISLPTLAFTIIAARPLIVLLFGKPFAPAAVVLPVLMAAFVPICFGYVMGSLALVVDRQRTFVLIAFAGVVFNVAGNLVLLPRYGYLAAAWMTVATEVAVMVPASITILRAMNLAPDLRRLPRAVLAVAIMAALVILARDAGAGALVLMVVAAVAYPIGVLGTGALTPDDRADLLSWLRRRARLA
jgi:O-antigen/teichoic acid export membrane protein